MSLDHLDDTPISDQPKLSAEAELFISFLDGLLDSDTVSYAFDTIEGIRMTVKQTGRVTEGQRDAIANIQEGARKRERNARRGGSRRYEGWRR